MIAFSIGIVVGVLLRSLAPLFGYPFSGAKWFVWWRRIWKLTPKLPGLFVVVAIVSLTAMIVLGLVLLPLMLISEYHLAVTKWWGFSYSVVGFLGIGAVLGFAVTSLMIEARQAGAKDVPTRGALLGGAVLVALVLILNHESGGSLLAVAKISTGAVTIEFNSDRSGRFGYVSPTANPSTEGQGAASERIATALSLLSTLDEAEQRDSQVFKIVNDRVPQLQDAPSPTFATTIADLAGQIADVHHFKRDVGPGLYMAGEILPSDLVILLRAIVTKWLWSSEIDPKEISEFNGKLSALLTKVGDARKLYCRDSPLGICKGPDQPRIVYLTGAELSDKPYVVLTLAMALHAWGETQAGAAIIDRWLLVKKQQQRKIARDQSATNLGSSQLALTQGKQQIARAYFTLAKMLSDNPDQNKLHKLMAVRYYRAAYDEMVNLIDAHPLVALVDRAVSRPRDQPLSVTEEADICQGEANKGRRRIVSVKVFMQNNFLYYQSQFPAVIEFEGLQSTIVDYRSQLEKVSVDCLFFGSPEASRKITRATFLDTISRTYTTMAELSSNRDDLRRDLCKAHAAAKDASSLLDSGSRLGYQRGTAEEGFAQLAKRLAADATWLLINTNARSVAKRVADSGYGACVSLISD
jgi:CRISPR/Cas system CMR-associated protein Cmr5 small subunit